MPSVNIMAAKEDRDGFQFMKTRRCRKSKRPRHVPDVFTCVTDERSVKNVNKEDVIRRIQLSRSDIVISDFMMDVKDMLECIWRHVEQLKVEALDDVQTDDTSRHPMAIPSTDYDRGLAVCTGITELVCYGIGNFTLCPIARHQLALLLILRDETMVPSTDCYVFDPVFTKPEKEILTELEFNLLQTNEADHAVTLLLSVFPSVKAWLEQLVAGPQHFMEIQIFSSCVLEKVVKCEMCWRQHKDYQQIMVAETRSTAFGWILAMTFSAHPSTRAHMEGKRGVRGPTLFYMPHCGRALYNNLLWSNWTPEHLPQVILIGNSFNDMADRTPDKIFRSQTSYIHNILQYTKEYPLKNRFRFDDIFNDTALQTFSFDELQNMELGFWSGCQEPEYDQEDVEIITNNKLES